MPIFIGYIEKLMSLHTDFRMKMINSLKQIKDRNTEVPKHN